jgi:hypothetical protein
MAQLTPPLAPPLPSKPTYGDLPAQHIDFRLWQIVMSAATIVLAGWFFTLNPIAGIIASFFAKHVLVAILAAGLEHPDSEHPTADVPAVPETERGAAP